MSSLFVSLAETTPKTDENETECLYVWKKYDQFTVETYITYLSSFSVSFLNGRTEYLKGIFNVNYDTRKYHLTG